MTSWISTRSVSDKAESRTRPAGGEAAVRQKILDYLGRGVEVEEILDFWHAVFPVFWKVSYDDETDTIQYFIKPEAIWQAD